MRYYRSIQLTLTLVFALLLIFPNTLTGKIEGKVKGKVKATKQLNKSTDIIMEALTDEMTRSMSSLKLEKTEKPYYLDYTVVDLRQLTIEASFGAIIKSGWNRQRLLKVGVRVGSYQMDNTEFLGRNGMYGAIMGHTGSLVVEDNYDAIRRDVWLSTDRAYKQAVEQLAEKQAFIKNQVQTDQVSDFSKSKPVKLIAPLRKWEVNKNKWQGVVKRLSNIFRQYPALFQTYVEMQVYLMHKYYVNSEGTVYRQPEILVSLVGLGITQAADGMKLKHYIPFHAANIEGLPSEKEMAAGIKQMAQELTLMTKAPALESFIGPVLFTRQASAELFTQVFLPHLSGQHPPLSSMPQMAQMVSASKLIRRIGRKVLPRTITILDDPARSDYNKTPLIGSYSVDDQGVPAQPVKLVEKGVLKSLLLGRRPGKRITQSNGHGRSAIMGKPGVQVSNLIITAENGRSYKQLKLMLMQMCKEQQLPFGLLIKTFDNPTITGLEPSLSARMMQNPQNPPLTAPILIYRVSANDGKEELVRGLSITELPVNDLKYISAVGDDAYVHHRLVAPTGGAMGSVFSIFSSGSGSGVRLPVSIVAPSLLFEEVEFEKIDEQRNKLPIMAHPYFKK
jgi:PmbA/TldA metallopeptidase C-terminal domain